MPGWSTSSLWTSAASTGCRCSSTSVRPSAARSWPGPAPSPRRPTRRAASTRPGCAGCCSAEELLYPPRLFGTPLRPQLLGSHTPVRPSVLASGKALVRASSHKILYATVIPLDALRIEFGVIGVKFFFFILLFFWIF
uniref:Uncharacterized protein n=1 Tax=Ixodes scapularis TaxID=6945 RepID=A0A4D5RCY0_IXOSC